MQQNARSQIEPDQNYSQQHFNLSKPHEFSEQLNEKKRIQQGVIQWHAQYIQGKFYLADVFSIENLKNIEQQIKNQKMLIAQMQEQNISEKSYLSYQQFGNVENEQKYENKSENNKSVLFNRKQKAQEQLLSEEHKYRQNIKKMQKKKSQIKKSLKMDQQVQISIKNQEKLQNNHHYQSNLQKEEVNIIQKSLKKSIVKSKNSKQNLQKENKQQNVNRKEVDQQNFIQRQSSKKSESQKKNKIQYSSKQINLEQKPIQLIKSQKKQTQNNIQPQNNSKSFIISIKQDSQHSKAKSKTKKEYSIKTSSVKVPQINQTMIQIEQRRKQQNQLAKSNVVSIKKASSASNKKKQSSQKQDEQGKSNKNSLINKSNLQKLLSQKSSKSKDVSSYQQKTQLIQQIKEKKTSQKSKQYNAKKQQNNTFIYVPHAPKEKSVTNKSFKKDKSIQWSQIDVSMYGQTNMDNHTSGLSNLQQSHISHLEHLETEKQISNLDMSKLNMKKNKQDLNQENFKKSQKEKSYKEKSQKQNQQNLKLVENKYRGFVMQSRQGSVKQKTQRIQHIEREHSLKAKSKASYRSRKTSKKKQSVDQEPLGSSRNLGSKIEKSIKKQQFIVSKQQLMNLHNQIKLLQQKLQKVQQKQSQLQRQKELIIIKKSNLISRQQQQNIEMKEKDLRTSQKSNQINTKQDIQERHQIKQLVQECNNHQKNVNDNQMQNCYQKKSNQNQQFYELKQENKSQNQKQQVHEHETQYLANNQQPIQNQLNGQKLQVQKKQQSQNQNQNPLQIYEGNQKITEVFSGKQMKIQQINQKQLNQKLQKQQQIVHENLIKNQIELEKHLKQEQNQNNEEKTIKNDFKQLLQGQKELIEENQLQLQSIQLNKQAQNYASQKYRLNDQINRLKKIIRDLQMEKIKSIDHQNNEVIQENKKQTLQLQNQAQSSNQIKGYIINQFNKGKDQTFQSINLNMQSKREDIGKIVKNSPERHNESKIQDGKKNSSFRINLSRKGSNHQQPIFGKTFQSSELSNKNSQNFQELSSFDKLPLRKKNQSYPLDDKNLKSIKMAVKQNSEQSKQLKKTFNKEEVLQRFNETNRQFNSFIQSSRIVNETQSNMSRSQKQFLNGSNPNIIKGLKLKNKQNKNQEEQLQNNNQMPSFFNNTTSLLKNSFSRIVNQLKDQNPEQQQNEDVPEVKIGTIQVPQLRTNPNIEMNQQELIDLAIQTYKIFGIQVDPEDYQFTMKKYKNCIIFNKANDTILWHYTGKFYIGGWKTKQNGQGEKSGEGIQIIPEKHIYKGQFLNGKKHGTGILKSNNGNIYDGQWIEGLKNGQGTYYDQTTKVFYSGQWKDGKKNGYGFLKFSQKEYYLGTFVKSVKEGYGIEVFVNGDKYKGQYKKGKFHGRGKYFWSNGSSYQGDFKQGMRHGNGSWKSARFNADIYVGTYLNDKKCGFGRYVWANGCIYQGNFADDVKHGKGKMIYSDGKQIKGEWNNGSLIEDVQKNHQKDYQQPLRKSVKNLQFHKHKL